MAKPKTTSSKRRAAARSPEDLFDAAAGSWAGKSLLFLPGDPPRESTMRAKVTRVAGSRFLRVDYTWSFERKSQQGELLVCHEEKKQRWSAVWADAWHQSSSFMQLSGDVGPAIDVLGQFEVEGHPPWGWRIRLAREGTKLELRMWNITPAGESMLAVESILTRRR